MEALDKIPDPPWTHSLATVFDWGMRYGAVVHLYRGELHVTMWLSDENYSKAVEGLRGAGWFPEEVDQTTYPEASRWKPTAQGGSYPVWLYRRTTGYGE